MPRKKTIKDRNGIPIPVYRGDQQQSERHLQQYTADELNAQCDLTAPMPTELRDFDNAPRAGSEAL